jgi:hypothetical protein
VIVVVDMLHTLDFWKKQKMSLQEYIFFSAKYKNVNVKYNFNLELYSNLLEVQFDFVFELLQIND